MKTFVSYPHKPQRSFGITIWKHRFFAWSMASLFLLSPLAAFSALPSHYRLASPRVDGCLTWNEWPESTSIEFELGTLTVLNDHKKLYLLFNVHRQDKFDPVDYVWVSFDVNQDGKITRGVDLNYALNQQTRNLNLLSYQGPNEWELIDENPKSSRGADFDAYLADGSARVTGPGEIERNPHRTWELAIDLDEIQAKPGDRVRLGFRVAAPSLDMIADVPPGFQHDFANMLEFDLDRVLVPVPEGDPNANISISGNPVEITQAIQTRDNSLPLVSAKTTIARVYINVSGTTTNQPLWVDLYGRRGGTALPGSPLTRLNFIPTTVNRTNLEDTANFLIPDSWTDGTVEFAVRVRDTFGVNYVALPTTVTFTRKEIPTFWVIPVNSGSAAFPDIVSNAEIQLQEDFAEAIFPVPDINFVQQPWTALGANVALNNTINELNDYHSRIFLAWILGYLFIGESPFDLPNQIYGMTTARGGSSDPVWIGENGWVARGGRGSSEEGTMAHEFNHNLDRDSSGTWGRHAKFGCFAPGPDPDWPYSNDDIHEVGIDTRVGSDPVVLDTFPDLMSYCGSGDIPTKWISPYRWTNLFHAFPNEGSSLTAGIQAAAINGDIQEVFYVSGALQINRTGQLKPVIRQPGIVSANVPVGDYLLVLGNRQGETLYELRFAAGFIDPDGEERPEVIFSHQLPAVEGTAQVLLYHRNNLLSNIRLSANPPEVQVTSPNGGEVWRGREESIKWEARDADDDDLMFDVLYTHNDGRNWRPLARGIRETTLPVNSLVLPGGNAARVRVIATDGLHTAQDDSDEPFTVLNKPPAPLLLAPAGNARPRADELIIFRGDPNDLEIPELPDDNCLWTMDGEVFGIGHTVEAMLPQGVHEIRFVAFDDMGQEGEAFMTLEVLPPTIGRLEIVQMGNRVVRIRWLASLGPGLQVARDLAGPFQDAQLPIWQEGDHFVTELETQDRSLFFRLIIITE